jgi:hypothetical protein
VAELISRLDEAHLLTVRHWRRLHGGAVHHAPCESQISRSAHRRRVAIHCGPYLFDLQAKGVAIVGAAGWAAAAWQSRRSIFKISLHAARRLALTILIYADEILTAPFQQTRPKIDANQEFVAIGMAISAQVS